MAGSPGTPRQFVGNLLTLQYREVAMTLAIGAVVATSVLLFPGTDSVLDGFEGSITPGTLLLLFAISTLAAMVKGTVGFGAALVSTPLVATIIDPTTAVVVLAVMPWMINIFQVGETRTGLTYVLDEWQLVGLSAAGTLLGLYFLSSFQSGVHVSFLMGVLLLGYVAYELTTGFVTVESAGNPVALGAVGFVEGFLLAAANMGGVLPAYLHTFERDTERFVGAIAIVMACVFSLRLVVMYPMGLLTPYRLWLGSAIATIAIGGLLLGTALRRVGIDQRQFDRVVVALLFVIGVNLLRKTVPELFL